MNIIDGPDLPVSCAMVAESSDRIALQVRLRARVLLPCIVQMQRILGGML